VAASFHLYFFPSLAARFAHPAPLRRVRQDAGAFGADQASGFAQVLIISIATRAYLRCIRESFANPTMW
jgi:hypothetical protein